MTQVVADMKYELDKQQNAELMALAKERQVAPGHLVREAVSKYLANADHESRRAAAMALLKHPERDNRLFGSWRDAGVDGVAYQDELRGK